MISKESLVAGLWSLFALCKAVPMATSVTSIGAKLCMGEGVSCGGLALWLDERGTTGDLTELYLRCEACEKELPLVRLQGGANQHTVLGLCQGERLWLGPAAREVCQGKMANPWESALDSTRQQRLLSRHRGRYPYQMRMRTCDGPSMPYGMTFCSMQRASRMSAGSGRSSEWLSA